MKLKYIIYLLSLIFLISCTEGIIKTEWITRPVHVYSVDIPESINLGQSINFKMTCETPDPCHEFSHLEIRDTVFNVWIKVYAKRDPKVICIQIFNRPNYVGVMDKENTAHFFLELIISFSFFTNESNSSAERRSKSSICRTKYSSWVGSF
jgi:hypothetical protein